MNISFERSGGVAGMRVTAAINSDTLPDAEASELKQLVDRAGFFDLPASSGPSGGADQFVYRVTIETEGRRHTVETTDAAAPPALQPLLAWLHQAARRSRRGGAP
ncbi:MAG: protealysin inhibitor emfourin [Gemmatimonadales bacterium]